MRAKRAAASRHRPERNPKKNESTPRHGKTSVSLQAVSPKRRKMHWPTRASTRRKVRDTWHFCTRGRTSIQDKLPVYTCWSKKVFGALTTLSCLCKNVQDVRTNLSEFCHHCLTESGSNVLSRMNWQKEAKAHEEKLRCLRRAAVASRWG